MDAKSVTRKLSAILSMDVQGYSRLMGDDEIATVKTITEYRETVASLVTEWKGRVVDSPGDNILAEFTSVVDAVQCAVEIQHVLKAKNNDLPENRRMIFRIGVNLGDVIQEGNRIYGDGVNIAARIESLADGGGISISGTAYDQIKNKLALGYIYSGEHPVKNITEPIRVYRVPVHPEDVENKKPKGKGWKKVVIPLAAVIVLVIAAAVWYFYPAAVKPGLEVASKKDPSQTSDQKMAPLSDKPSIAVLPFDNFSKDENQDYFSDGMSEDLITDLSKVSDLFVKSRKSSFVFKGKQLGATEIAKKLGVNYILEGSVRRSGNRIRINAQLIDAKTGHHLWAERYDEKIDDIFGIQDKITKKIVTALALKLTPAEEKNIERKGTQNIAAYDALLKGRAQMHLGSPESSAKAISHYKQAIELDPNYGEAYAELATVYNNLAFMGLHKKLGMSYQELRLAEREALDFALKKDIASAYSLNSIFLAFQHRHDECIAAAKRALDLDPNNAMVLWQAGFGYILGDQPEVGVKLAEKAMKLDPNCLY